MSDKAADAKKPGQTGELKRKILSSGNPELDSKMGGGLPSGTLLLIEGSSGAGKSVLSQQILWGALQSGLRATVFTSENSVKSLLSQMESIDLDVMDYLLPGRLRVHSMELARLGESAPVTLLDAMRTYLTKPDLIVIDSFTSAISHAKSDVQILQFFESCKRLCASGMTLLVTLHDSMVNQDLLSALRSMCDAHVILRSEKDGQRLIKTLEVVKIRGAGSVTGAIVGFDVEPGWGMRLIPISKARG